MTAEKDFIRAEALRHRTNLQLDPDWPEQAARQFFATLAPQPGRVVSLYYPKGKEFDPLPIAEKLWDAKIAAALPMTRAQAEPLVFARWDRDTKLQDGAFGIPVPENPIPLDPDIVVVPLLVFDQRGHRLGYGKGHYDATLKDLRARKDILAVGLAYAEQACLFALPSEDHDQKLDLVVTPQRVFDFRQ